VFSEAERRRCPKAGAAWGLAILDHSWFPGRVWLEGARFIGAGSAVLRVRLFWRASRQEWRGSADSSPAGADIDAARVRVLIARGRECLVELRGRLATARARLEEWAAYERICGKNPAVECVEGVDGMECVAGFLPGWIERRGEEVDRLNREMMWLGERTGLGRLYG
jgi:hypothetical protein